MPYGITNNPDVHVEYMYLLRGWQGLWAGTRHSECSVALARIDRQARKDGERYMLTQQAYPAPV